MTGRRELHETLTEITHGIIFGGAVSGLVHVSSVELTLPIEIRLPLAGNDLIGDLPLFRMRTAFDPEPATLQMTLQEVAL